MKKIKNETEKKTIGNILCRYININKLNKENKMKKIKNETEKKTIGNYKTIFNWKFNKKDSDYIFLSIEISEDFHNLLNEVVVKDEDLVDVNIRSCDNSGRFKRYKVKRWVLNSLGGAYIQVLFLKTLIDTSKITLKFDSTRDVEDYIYGFKENMRNFIKLVRTYNLEDNGRKFSYEVKEEALK